VKTAMMTEVSASMLSPGMPLMFHSVFSY